MQIPYYSRVDCPSTHIYREANGVTGGLAKRGSLQMDIFFVYESPKFYVQKVLGMFVKWELLESTL